MRSACQAARRLNRLNLSMVLLSPEVCIIRNFLILAGLEMLQHMEEEIAC